MEEAFVIGLIGIFAGGTIDRLTEAKLDRMKPNLIDSSSPDFIGTYEGRGYHRHTHFLGQDRGSLAKGLEMTIDGTLSFGKDAQAASLIDVFGSQAKCLTQVPVRVYGNDFDEPTQKG